MKYLEIWQEAYEKFTDGSWSEGIRYMNMQAYLMNQVKQGNLSIFDKCIIEHDIVSMERLYD